MEIEIKQEKEIPEKATVNSSTSKGKRKKSKAKLTSQPEVQEDKGEQNETDIIENENKEYVALYEVKPVKISSDGDDDRKRLYKTIKKSEKIKVKELWEELAGTHSKDWFFGITNEKKGKNVFHIAAYFNKAEIFKYLLEQASLLEGAGKLTDSLNQADNSGKTPLHYAAIHPDGEIVSEILKQEVQVNVEDSKKVTPLHLAAYYGSDKAASALLTKGANFNAKDNLFNNPVHVTIIARKEQVLRLLLPRKPEVNAKNKFGKTPLHLSTERNQIDVSDMLTSNGADVSIRYQYKKEIDKIRGVDEVFLERDISVRSKLNRWGFDEQEDNGSATDSVRDKLQEKLEKKHIEKERDRAKRWAPMIIKWDKYSKKNPEKIKSRARKGFPDCLRSQAWKLLTQTKQRDPELYQKLMKEASSSSDQIDLDINRSFRTHVFFRERFGQGQIALFNVLKAYSGYDKEVGYVQGMSDITAFLLMYLTEEDTFWMLADLLNNPKYNMRGMYLIGFPLLMQHFYVHERIMETSNPKLSKHLKDQGLESAHYLTRWFLMIFLHSLPFPIIVRIWDIFLYEGYDFIFSVTYSLIKLLEDKVMKGGMDEIFSSIRNLEHLDMKPDDFIEFVLKHKVDKKKIHKFQEEYKMKELQRRIVKNPDPPAPKKKGN